MRLLYHLNFCDTIVLNTTIHRRRKLYHLTTHIRVKKSAELIKEALIKCLHEKDFSLISVSDLQKISGVSRATFYRIFDNIYDVLCYYCDQLVIDIDEQYDIFLKSGGVDIYKFVLSFWTENYEFLEALYISQRWDILQTSMETHAKNLRAHLTKSFISNQEADYFFSITSGALSGILMTWIRHGKKEDISSMDEKIKDILQFFVK